MHTERTKHTNRPNRPDRPGRRKARRTASCAGTCPEALEGRTLLSAGYTFHPVALLNAPTPGPAGDTFSPAGGFEVGGINNAGQAGFAAYVNSNGSAAGEGVYRTAGDEITQLIRQGDPAPGGSTFGGFGTFSPAAINNKGDVAIGFGREPATATLGINAALYEASAATGKVSALVLPGVTAAPTGGHFQGIGFHASINDAGQVAFAGIVHSRVGPGSSADLGEGIFEVDSAGHVTDVAAPGDAAPGGKVFDFAQNPPINAQGDVAFGAHVSGDPVISLGQTFPSAIFAAESIYLKDHHGKVISIAHQGSAIPATAGGGGVFDFAFGPSVNSQGQVLFMGAVRQSATNADPLKDQLGLFLYSQGNVYAIARPGTKMPGGGTFASGSFYVSNYGLNNPGDVVFNCSLSDGQQGVYHFSHGKLSLVAKTGTVIPGFGTIKNLDFGIGQPSAGAAINDHGQLLFGATFKEGGGALLVATPKAG